MEPNPKCPQCRGTGKIELFTSVIACECRFAKDGSRQPQVSVSVGLKLPPDDDTLLDMFNNHGNGD